jgi:hypothetical protein
MMACQRWTGPSAVAAGVLLAGLWLTPPAAAQTAEEPARGRVLRGTVVDDAGVPLAGAEIFVGRARVATRTDATGAFLTRTTQQGLLAVGARQPLHRPAIDVVKVQSGEGDLEFAFVLVPITLTGDSARDARAGGEGLPGEITAMQARFSSGAGTVFTWREIEKRQVQFLSQLLEAGVPGLRAPSARIGSGRISSSRFATNCQPLIVVDGLAWRAGGNLDELPPQIVQTIEVYRGGSTAPMRLGFDTGCGAIVITTRTGR